MNIKKILLTKIMLFTCISIYSQTTKYFTDKYVFKMPDPITEDWPEQWSAPKEMSVVIQFDFINNIIYYTSETSKRVYLLKKSYPEIDLNADWKTRNYICTNKGGDEVEIDIQRKVLDNSTNILFYEPSIKLMYLFTVKKIEN